MRRHSFLYYYLASWVGHGICAVKGHKYEQASEVVTHARTGTTYITQYVYCTRHF